MNRIKYYLGAFLMLLLSWVNNISTVSNRNEKSEDLGIKVVDNSKNEVPPMNCTVACDVG